MQASSDADLAEPRSRRGGPESSNRNESEDNDEHHLKILVVDDEAAIRDVLAAYLQEHGHHVVSAANGREALKIFAQGEWDLVMTDGLMPEMSGSEFAHEIKKQDANVPIFLVSGSSDMVQAASEELSPIDRFIRKPCTRETLAAALASLDSSSHRH
jgi:CheY-like chemotaxis protein